MLYSGDACTKYQIEEKLGNEIKMYKISAYLWNLKVNAGAVIRPTREGRKVTGYTLINPKEVKFYLNMRNIPIPKTEKEINHDSTS